MERMTSGAGAADGDGVAARGVSSLYTALAPASLDSLLATSPQHGGVSAVTARMVASPRAAVAAGGAPTALPAREMQVAFALHSGGAGSPTATNAGAAARATSAVPSTSSTAGASTATGGYGGTGGGGAGAGAGAAAGGAAPDGEHPSAAAADAQRAPRGGDATLSLARDAPTVERVAALMPSTPAFAVTLSRRFGLSRNRSRKLVELEEKKRDGARKVIPRVTANERPVKRARLEHAERAGRPPASRGRDAAAEQEKQQNRFFAEGMHSWVRTVERLTEEERKWLLADLVNLFTDDSKVDLAVAALEAVSNNKPYHELTSRRSRARRISAAQRTFAAVSGGAKDALDSFSVRKRESRQKWRQPGSFGPNRGAKEALPWRADVPPSMRKGADSAAEGDSAVAQRRDEPGTGNVAPSGGSDQDGAAEAADDGASGGVASAGASGAAARTRGQSAGESGHEPSGAADDAAAHLSSAAPEEGAAGSKRRAWSGASRAPPGGDELRWLRIAEEELGVSQDDVLTRLDPAVLDLTRDLFSLAGMFPYAQVAWQHCSAAGPVRERGKAPSEFHAMSDVQGRIAYEVFLKQVPSKHFKKRHAQALAHALFMADPTGAGEARLSKLMAQLRADLRREADEHNMTYEKVAAEWVAGESATTAQGVRASQRRTGVRTVRAAAGAQRAADGEGAGGHGDPGVPLSAPPAAVLARAIASTAQANTTPAPAVTVGAVEPALQPSLPGHTGAPLVSSAVVAPPTAPSHPSP